MSSMILASDTHRRGSLWPTVAKGAKARGLTRQPRRLLGVASMCAHLHARPVGGYGNMRGGALRWEVGWPSRRMSRCETMSGGHRVVALAIGRLAAQAARRQGLG